jgi:hypothetical protein
MAEATGTIKNTDSTINSSAAPQLNRSSSHETSPRTGSQLSSPVSQSISQTKPADAPTSSSNAKPTPSSSTRRKLGSPTCPTARV